MSVSVTLNGSVCVGMHEVYFGPVCVAHKDKY